MKKTAKQEVLSRLLVCSSFLVLTAPLVAQAVNSVPVSAETGTTQTTKEASAETSEIISTQESNVVKEASTEIPVESESESVESTKENSTDLEKTLENTTDSSVAQNDRQTKASTINAISADLSLLKGQTTENQPDNQTLAGTTAQRLGSKGNFVTNTSDLVAGNTIVIAEITQTTTDPSGAKVHFARDSSPLTLLDNDSGEIVGTIQYDGALKAITLKVTNTVVNEADTQNYSFVAPWLMIINYETPGSVIAKMPFSNTLSISGKNYVFNFTKIAANVAASIKNDVFRSDGGALKSTFTRDLYHEDIASNQVLNELQNSGGAKGAVLENLGVKESFRVSSISGLLGVADNTINMKTYYVSADTNKIQALDGRIEALDGSTGSTILATVNSGKNLSLAELQAQATSTGVYYSL